MTSVLSIMNRITGVFLSLCSVVLVAWLGAIAEGPQAYARLHAILFAWPGQLILLGCTFSFFLHFCGGIRHLIWDAGYGFELRTIYISGWTVVAASVTLTAATWIVGLLVGRPA